MSGSSRKGKSRNWSFPLEERFWGKVDRRGPSGCWPWLAGLRKDGYGNFRIGSRTDGTRTCALAHRVAYELLVGPIPKGLTLDHLCRNRACVNPEHLEPVGLVENILRGESPHAQHARQTHCIHGHPFNKKNTGSASNGRHRFCRRCLALRSRKRRALQRARKKMAA